MTVKLETFTAEPPCAGCTKLLEIAEEFEEEYEGEVEVINHIGLCEEFEEYDLKVVPAVVLNEGKIKIMGVCPSRRTLKAALKEMGL